jgi:hypothetical protein
MPAKIMNSSELNLFLKVLAEESVKQAYMSELSSSSPLFEEDPLFGGGSEGGDEENKEEDGDEEKADSGGGEEDPLADMGGDEEEDAAAEPEPAAEPAAEPKKVEARPTPLTLELGEITTDGLVSTLNMIRAGRSFKEPEISAEIGKYFENQLNDSERLALATFLSALRDITSGKPAEDAPEPGDENINIDANDQEREEARPRRPSKPALQQQQQQNRPRPQVPSQRMSKGTEDTSPPIQVGPRNGQLAEEYRTHIRSLLIK